MHGGSHTGVGHPPKNNGTIDTASSHAQLFSGPSLFVPGVTGSSEILHSLFPGSNNDSQMPWKILLEVSTLLLPPVSSAFLIN